MATLVFTDLTPDVPVSYILNGIPGTVTPTQIAPISSDKLEPQRFELGTGTQAIDTAYAFTGSALVYSLVTTTTGVEIDAGTGVVSINTDSTGPLGGVTVTVRATNSGGTADQPFTVTVGAVAPTSMLAGEFNGGETWNGTGGFTITGGALVYADPGATLFKRHAQTAANMNTVPSVFGVYNVDISVKSIDVSGNAGGNLSVGFRAGGTNYPTPQVNSTSGPNGDGTGLHQYTLNWTAGDFEEVRVNTASLTGISIEYIRITPQ